MTHQISEFLEAPKDYKDSDDLVKDISLQPAKTEREKLLVKYYVSARFRPYVHEWERRYVGGDNDGGIDYFNREDSTFYIFQAKFSQNESKQDESEVVHELDKINNAIKGESPNKRAEDFVNELKSSLEPVRILVNGNSPLV